MAGAACPPKGKGKGKKGGKGKGMKKPFGY